MRYPFATRVAELSGNVVERQVCCAHLHYRPWTGLIRRAVAVNWRNLALGHEVFEADGATFVRNLALPAVYDANFVFGVTVSEPDDIERLLARAAERTAHAARLTFRVGPFTPPAFEARLALEGYERSEALVLLLDGPLRGEARRLEMRLVEDEATWRAYTELKHLDWREHAPEHAEDVTGPRNGAARLRRRAG